MGWKNWPYWLKGGIVTTLIIFFIDLFTRPLFPYFRESFLILTFILWGLNIIIHYPSILILETFLEENKILFEPKELFTLVKVYVIPLSLLIWFIIGSVIGWLFEKLKKKK